NLRGRYDEALARQPTAGVDDHVDDRSGGFVENDIVNLTQFVVLRAIYLRATNIERGFLRIRKTIVSEGSVTRHYDSSKEKYPRRAPRSGESGSDVKMQERGQCLAENDIARNGVSLLLYGQPSQPRRV